MTKTEAKKFAEILGEIKNIKSGNSVANCNFVGVQFDAKAVDAINTIATGLVENAKSLGLLAQVLKASSVELETMLKVMN